VVRRFSTIFFGAHVLVEPKPLLTKFARLPGLDGDKKNEARASANTIMLSDSPERKSLKAGCGQMYNRSQRRVSRRHSGARVEGNPGVHLPRCVSTPTPPRWDDSERPAPTRAGQRFGRDVEVKDESWAAAALKRTPLDPIPASRRAAARLRQGPGYLARGPRRRLPSAGGPASSAAGTPGTAVREAK